MKKKFNSATGFWQTTPSDSYSISRNFYLGEFTYKPRRYYHLLKYYSLIYGVIIGYNPFNAFDACCFFGPKINVEALIYKLSQIIPRLEKRPEKYNRTLKFYHNILINSDPSHTANKVLKLKRLYKEYRIASHKPQYKLIRFYVY